SGMTVTHEDEVANRFCPSVDAIIFVVIFSGKRNPSKGARLDDLKTCSTLVAAAGVSVGVIVGVVAVFCGLFGFSGLIGGCVRNVAYTVLPSTENALPPLNAAAAPAGSVPARPRIVSVSVSKRKGPAINLDPS